MSFIHSCLHCNSCEIKFSTLLDEQIATELEVEEVKTSGFYMLPKIYKQENHGRSLIGSVSCHTSSIS